MRNVSSVSLDESSILILCSFEWSWTQFVLQCNQWFHNRLIFFSLFITFRKNIPMRIIPSPCLFFFALHLEWFLNSSTDKKSSVICIIAKLPSTLFSLWFKFLLAWSYFLLKRTQKRGQKVAGKNLNVYRQFFKDIIRVFLYYSV